VADHDLADGAHPVGVGIGAGGQPLEQAVELKGDMRDRGVGGLLDCLDAPLGDLEELDQLRARRAPRVGGRMRDDLGKARRRIGRRCDRVPSLALRTCGRGAIVTPKGATGLAAPAKATLGERGQRPIVEVTVLKNALDCFTRILDTEADQRRLDLVGISATNGHLQDQKRGPLGRPGLGDRRVRLDHTFWHVRTVNTPSKGKLQRG
jgi:hypothetical protein